MLYHSLTQRLRVNLAVLFVFSGIFLSAFAAENQAVNITANLPYVDVKHNGKTVRIKRIADTGNIIELDFALTSRPCPPYCIQPMRLANGVETIGELEILKYLQQSTTNDSILIIDSREPKWLASGMIPGAMNISWDKLYNKTASDKDIADILQFQFNAVLTGKLWNFENVKTLVFYCNGAWCGQSPTNIRALLSLGYPANRIKWYRGGMQSWKQLGLTTVKP